MGKIKNKKAAIGTTLTWIFATIFIVFILAIFLFVIIPILVKNSKSSEVSSSSEAYLSEINNKQTDPYFYSSDYSLALALVEFLEQDAELDDYYKKELKELAGLGENEKIKYYELIVLDFSGIKKEDIEKKDRKDRLLKNLYGHTTTDLGGSFNPGLVDKKCQEFFKSQDSDKESIYYCYIGRENLVQIAKRDTEFPNKRELARVGIIDLPNKKTIGVYYRNDKIK